MANVGILLSPGEGIKTQKKTGQFSRFLNYYLNVYEKNFDSVFVFSYLPERFDLSSKIRIIPNNLNLHRFLYEFVMSFINFEIIKKIHIFRVMQLTGSMPAIIAKLFFGKPFVATYGYKYHEFAKIEGKIFQFLVLKIFEPIAIWLADGIIVTTRELMGYVSRFKNKNRIFLIPNGVDTKFFYPTQRKEKRKKEIVVLAVGRLERQKNYLNLVRAVSSLENYRRIILRLVGDGSQKDEILSLAKKLNVNIEIISNISHDQMPKVYQSADIFVIPSITEGHPKTLLEALSCGLPCIGSNVSGIKEIIKDKENGLLSETNYLDISSKIKLVLSDVSLKKKFSKNGRKFIVENFDINLLVSKEMKIFKTVLKRKGKS